MRRGITVTKADMIRRLLRAGCRDADDIADRVGCAQATVRGVMDRDGREGPRVAPPTPQPRALWRVRP